MAWSDENKEKAFEQIMESIIGGKSLRQSLREKDTPSSETFYNWIKETEKSKQYARACEDRADSIFDEILEIADATANDIVIDENGKEVVNHHVIQRDRLRIDARKWNLSKMQPKKYGDKLDGISDGDNDDARPKLQIEIIERPKEDNI